MFKLVIMPSGKGILTTHRPLTQKQADELRAIWDRWLGEDGHGVLIAPETDVVKVLDIELALDIKLDSPAP